MTDLTPEAPKPDEPEPAAKRKAPLWHKIGAVAGIVALSVVALADSGLDFAGDLRSSKTSQKMSDESWEKWDKIYTPGSPVEKFELEFMNRKTVIVSQYEGGSGILKFMAGGGTEYAYDFGTVCLKNTPYDTEKGSESTGAAGVVYSSANSDQIEVVPDNQGLERLHLRGIDSNGLVPVAEPDKDILEAYGCDLDYYREG